MADQIFDHEKLDVYGLSIEYAGETFRIAETLSGLHRHSRDQYGCEQPTRFRSTLPRETANEASRTVLVSSIFRAARHWNARQFRTCC